MKIFAILITYIGLSSAFANDCKFSNDICDLLTKKALDESRTQHQTELTRRRLSSVVEFYVRESDEYLKKTKEQGIDRYLDQIDQMHIATEIFNKWKVN